MYEPQKHHRHSVRLHGYDYAQPCSCFITICTQNRCVRFGSIVGGQPMLNNVGEIVHEIWHQIPDHFHHVTLDEFIVMPNHVHGIITTIKNESSARMGVTTTQRDGNTPMNGVPLVEGGRTQPSQIENRGVTIGQIVAYFKYLSTKKINAIWDIGIQKIWQRNYYEHIIRDEGDLNRIRKYIHNNPLNWKTDNLYAPNQLHPPPHQNKRGMNVNPA